MISSKYNQFIGMYNNVYPEGFCHHAIDEFDRLLLSGVCGNRQTNEGSNKTLKEDYFYFLNLRGNNFSDFHDNKFLDVFWSGLQSCFNNYVDEYDILKDFNIRATTAKVQKTDPGSGYHVWHCEHSHIDPERCLVYILYLNDNIEAGETEFLYQKLRIPPKENSVVIWPASFTHTHRGNVVHGNNSKYIITGWFVLE